MSRDVGNQAIQTTIDSYTISMTNAPKWSSSECERTLGRTRSSHVHVALPPDRLLGRPRFPPVTHASRYRMPDSAFQGIL